MTGWNRAGRECPCFWPSPPTIFHPRPQESIFEDHNIPFLPVYFYFIYQKETFRATCSSLNISLPQVPTQIISHQPPLLTPFLSPLFSPTSPFLLQGCHLASHTSPLLQMRLWSLLVRGDGTYEIASKKGRERTRGRFSAFVNLHVPQAPGAAAGGPTKDSPPPEVPSRLTSHQQGEMGTSATCLIIAFRTSARDCCSLRLTSRAQDESLPLIDVTTSMS